MNEQVEGKEKGQKQWLKEHETIQVDLLKMKDELLSEINGNREKEKHGTKLPRQIEKVPAPKASERTAAQDNSRASKPQEMTIRQMLGGIEKPPKREFRENGNKEPPKLPDGKIPTSPDLTAKIANVLQLEDKLKRRKFELEKRARTREVPPPPTRPVMEEEIVTERVEDVAVDEAHEIELTRYTREEEDQFEEVEEMEVEEEADVVENKILDGEDGLATSKKKEKNGNEQAEHEKRSKKSHHEERRKKRRGIWALFGRG